MNKTWQVIKYLTLDLIAAALAWTIFFIYRKEVIEPQFFNGWNVPFEFTTRFYQALFFIPLFWITLYYITGFYKNIFRRSRLLELWQTFTTSLAGVIIIFFLFILDDWIGSYKNYYQLALVLFAAHFVITYFFRLILTAQTIHKIHHRKIGFNTLIIGSNSKAVKLYQEMTGQQRPAGNKFVGYVPIDKNSDDTIGKFLPKLGNIDDILTILDEEGIEEVILALESNEHKKASEILTVIENRQITIWGIPDLYDFLSGTVKVTAIYGSPLIKISNGLMPAWQENMKRLLDVLFSIIAMAIFFPVFIVLAIIIKSTSHGPIIYKQERVGRYGKPFHIFKLRSMVNGAENGTPALSSETDARVTPIGRFLRKTHLDEIPQFYNVLIGEMSLVGPRPERQYYIDQIVKFAPHYTHLHKLKPGITSWGQVKYGYASNVEEMLERLPFDMMYLKNISLYIDFKILIYTVMVSIKGNGK
ncbi:MAG TPA: sugar transferase [Draconibacterium sp.]|nr:sugar transferase [Draconibacterium sp.]